jgi:hypothetical protein
VNQTVIRLQGRSVVSTAPVNGSALVWNNGLSQWAPGPGSSAGGGVYEYSTVAAAEAAAPGQNAIGFVAETDSFYRFMLTEASTTVRDGKVILTTGSGGNTRWVAVAGRYGNIANWQATIPNNATHGSSTNVFLGSWVLGGCYYTTNTFTTGYWNVAIGGSALGWLQTGYGNTCVGVGAGYRTATTASGNTMLGSTGPRYAYGYFTDSIAIGNSAAYGGYIDDGMTAVNLVAIGNSAAWGSKLYGTDIVMVGADCGARRWPDRTVAVGSNAAYMTTYITGAFGINNLMLGAGAGGGTWITGVNNILLAATSAPTTGSRNVYLGRTSSSSNTTGTDNVALGGYAYLENTGKSYCVCAGFFSGIGGGNNVIAIGFENFRDCATWPANAPNNIAFGYRTLHGVYDGAAGLTGNYNIAFGADTLAYASYTSSENIAIGHLAGKFTYRANKNIFIGYRAGYGDNGSLAFDYGYNCSGSNIILGTDAFLYIRDVAITGPVDHFNVACGHSAGAEVRAGFRNTFLGNASGNPVTNGDDNTCLGYNAGVQPPGVITWTYNTWYNADGVTFSSVDNGKYAFIRDTGQWFILDVPTPPIPNTGYGEDCLFEVLWGYRQTSIGYGAFSLTLDDVRLGALGTTTVHGGTYTTDSDARFKTAVEDCDLGLGFIKALRPRRFRMKVNPGGPINHGFVAQEVGEALVGVESNIRPKPEAVDATQAVTYEAIIAPLTVALQDLAAKVVSLRARVQFLKDRANSSAQVGC